METAPSREGSINQVKSSSSLTRRACNSRSDHVCPASACGHDYSYCKENLIGCNRGCSQPRNGGEDISELRRDECGDAIDTVPSREFAVPDDDRKNKFVNSAERDRFGDVTSRTADDEATKIAEDWIPQSERSTYVRRRRKTRCPSSGACSANLDTVNLLYNCSPRERTNNDKVACGDSPVGRKEFGLAPSPSCHETSIDLDGGNAGAESAVTGDARPSHEDTWKLEDDTWTTSCCRRVDSSWRRCHTCEHHARKEFALDLLRPPPCERCCSGCHHHHYRDCHCDCFFHWHCCCQQRSDTKGCETHSEISDGRARHKSWRDQTRGGNGRLCAAQCFSKLDCCPGIMSRRRERNDDEETRGERKANGEDENEDEDGGVAVINHKDSMCILAEKYKAGNRRCRGRKCGERGDRTGSCNKSLTSEIIDQPESPGVGSVNAVPLEGPTKHVCPRCESCAGIARVGHGRHATTPPEGEFKSIPLSEPTAATRCCLNRAPCRRVL